MVNVSNTMIGVVCKLSKIMLIRYREQYNAHKYRCLQQMEGQLTLNNWKETRSGKAYNTLNIICYARILLW